jgi:hypothetical protein
MSELRRSVVRIHAPPRSQGQQVDGVGRGGAADDPERGRQGKGKGQVIGQPPGEGDASGDAEEEHRQRAGRELWDVAEGVYRPPPMP